MEIGWAINIETTNGVVGMWTSCLGSGFKIFYPLIFKIPDEIILKNLNVSMAKPVTDTIFGKRLWAPYYSERLEGDYGRVWIDHNSEHSYGHEMLTIKEKMMKYTYAGHNRTNTIWTNEFTFCSEMQPDAPNNKEKYIQPYKGRFIKLLVEIANYIGDIQAVNIDSGLVLYTPETLDCEYKRFKENRGEYCYARKGDVEIMLKKCNSMISWQTVIRYPMTSEELTAEWLENKLDSFDNSQNSFNPLPLMESIIRRQELCNNWK